MFLTMKFDEWKAAAEVFDHTVVPMAALIGGIWVLFRFVKERTNQAALKIAVAQRSTPFKDKHLVAIEVSLENKGKTRIVAKIKRSKDGLAFDDTVEKLRHCCELQIKKFREDQPPPVGHVDWFETGIVEYIPGLNAEINMLTEYENPEKRNEVDFYMEPGEAYHLEAPVVLPAGIYLAKVSFVATGGDRNFWSRVFTFAVPVSNNPERLS